MKTTDARLFVEIGARVQEMPDGMTCGSKVLLDDSFILVEAEELSFEDAFMKYVPHTEAENKVKMLICEAMNAGVKNFYRAKYDPSFYQGGICFKTRRLPATDRTYNWWCEAARNYAPAYNSRLGTRLQYGAFLGVLIKKLVQEGKTIVWAWNAVCNDSKELGHYRNSENAEYDFELTGSRCVCGFYDLANTCKLLAEDEDCGGFWIASGGCDFLSFSSPVGELYHHCDPNIERYYDVGWVVLSN